MKLETKDLELQKTRAIEAFGSWENAQEILRPLKRLEEELNDLSNVLAQLYTQLIIDLSSLEINRCPFTEIKRAQTEIYELKMQIEAILATLAQTENLPADKSNFKSEVQDAASDLLLRANKVQMEVLNIGLLVEQIVPNIVQIRSRCQELLAPTSIMDDLVFPTLNTQTDQTAQIEQPDDEGHGVGF